MSRAKNQHYVPQFYLRRFTRDGTQIHVYDKHTHRSFKTNIKNVASETGFYDISQEQMVSLREQLVEQARADDELELIPELEQQVAELTRIEAALASAEAKMRDTQKALLTAIGRSARWLDASPRVSSIPAEPGPQQDRVMRRLLESEPVTGVSRAHLQHYIALQLIRTREYRNFLLEFSAKFRNVLSAKILRAEGFSEEESNVEWTLSSEGAHMLHLEHLLDPEYELKIAESLANHIVSFVANRTDKCLYTSDNPVVRTQEGKTLGRGYGGLLSPGAQIYLPLTPRYGIALMEPNYFSIAHPLANRVVPLDVANVTFLNSAVVAQSFRQIFCPTDDFGLVEQMWHDMPDLFDPNRPRVNVL